MSVRAAPQQVVRVQQRVLVLVELPEETPDDVEVVVREVVAHEVDVALLVQLEEHLGRVGVWVRVRVKVGVRVGVGFGVGVGVGVGFGYLGVGLGLG